MNIVWLFLLIILAVCSLSAQETTVDRKQNFALQSKLEMTDEINCADTLLILVLKLSFTNTGERNVIIRKAPPLLASHSIDVILPDKTEKTLQSGRSEYLSGRLYENYESPDPANFAVLKTNDTLQIQNIMQSVYLFSPKSRTALKDGQYTATFNFVPFPFSTNPARLDWSKYGILVTSFSPISLDFTIDGEKMKSSKSAEECHAVREKSPSKACIISNGKMECGN